MRRPLPTLRESSLSSSAPAQELRQAPAGTAAQARALSLPLHPFLFAAYSVLALYASNLSETSFSDVAAALAGVLAAALVLAVVFGLMLRSFGARAAALASALLVPSLFYAAILSRIEGLTGVALGERAGLLCVAGIAAALLLAAWRAPGRTGLGLGLGLANSILNGVAFVLFIVPAGEIAVHDSGFGLSVTTPADAAPPRPADLPLAGWAPRAALATADLPDIVYVIFDRYASAATLREEYGFDNTPLLQFLRAQGFFIADRSTSNYLKTAPSVASTFHMDYLDAVAADPRAKRNEWQPLYEMLDEHRVGRVLKSLGYRFVQVGSWWRPTQHNALADESEAFGLSEFNWLFLRRTIVPPLLDAFAPQSRLARRVGWDNGQCQRVPRQIGAIEGVAERPGPTFLFAHVLLPHEPYVFDADGRCMPLEEVNGRSQATGYIGQIRYANQLIRQMVSSLLAQGRRKPVIIIQADEGPFPERYRTSDRSWREASEAELKMKTRILNAYFFPDRDYSSLSDDITPVNTFRMVFNKYFGSDLPRLPDRVFAHPDYSHLYDYFDVTGTVRGG